MKRLRQLMERLDRLSPRERTFVLVAALAVVIFGFDLLFWEPFRQERQQLRTAIGQAEARLATLAAEREQVIARAQEDPDLENRQRLERLRSEILRLDRLLAERTGEMIPPREMARVLEELLTRRTGLRLVALQNLPAISLHPDGALAGKDRTGEGLRIYRHPLRITFEGSFLETLDYLRQVEALPRRLFWENLEIDVVEHPRARITLTVFTLSLQREWIGV